MNTAGRTQSLRIRRLQPYQGKLPLSMVVALIELASVAMHIFRGAWDVARHKPAPGLEFLG